MRVEQSDIVFNEASDGRALGVRCRQETRSAKVQRVVSDDEAGVLVNRFINDGRNGVDGKQD